MSDDKERAIIQLKTASAALARARRNAARVAALAIAAGVSERAAAELLGVNRRTVRSWLGKTG